MRTPKEFVADIPALMEEWDFEKNTSLCIFPNKLGSQSNTYAYWVCKYGHKWKAKINNRYNGRGCPECKKRLQTSFPEQAVFFYVKQKYPDAINSYTDCFNNGMELDVFIPSLNVGIEYDGKAWHDDDKLKNEKLKYDICRHHSIKLIRVKKNMGKYYKGESVGMKKYGAVTGVNGELGGQGYTAKFSGEPMDYDSPNGFIYPIVGAFRALVTEINGRYSWKADPFKVLDKAASNLVANTIGMSREKGNNPNATGKSPSLWQTLFMTVMMYSSVI